MTRAVVNLRSRAYVNVTQRNAYFTRIANQAAHNYCLTYRNNKSRFIYRSYNILLYIDPTYVAVIITLLLLIPNSISSP